MVNYIPKYKALVVQAEREPQDLRAELSRFPCARVAIHGTPDNLAALSEYPEIEKLSLRGCNISDLSAMRGLSMLRQLSVAFGPLSTLDLNFCRETLETLTLTRLRRLKDLSPLSLMPKLEHLEISHIHSFKPPDFRSFPNLGCLSIWNTEWRSLGWLAHLPHIDRLHISQIKVEDKDWRPILNLSRLRHLHGMQSAFGSAAYKEFLRLRPDVRVDQGIPVDLEKYPQTREYLEKAKKRAAR